MKKQDLPGHSAHLKADVSAVRHWFAQLLRQEKSPEPIISDNPGTTSALNSKLPTDPVHACATKPALTGNRDKLRGWSESIRPSQGIDLERLTTVVVVANENLSGTSM